MSERLIQLADILGINLRRPETSYTCADCGHRSQYGEIHTILFCQLYKDGWTRKQIVFSVMFTADALRDAGQDSR